MIRCKRCGSELLLSESGAHCQGCGVIYPKSELVRDELAAIVGGFKAIVVTLIILTLAFLLFF